MNKFRCFRLAVLGGGVCIAATVLWLSDIRPGHTTGTTALETGRFVPGEEYPGGKATSRKRGQNRNAFSHPSGTLGFEDEFKFKLGNGIFRKLWVSSPASTKSSDGLGPHYNARACQRCHLKDGRGHPPARPDDNFVSMLFRIGVPPTTPKQIADLKAHRANTFPDPVYGGQIQDFAVQGHKAEARPRITYEEITVSLSGGETATLRKPTYTFGNLASGPLSPDTMVSPRIANQMIGLGLLEAIPAQKIQEIADPDDNNNDGISGRPNLVWGVRQNRVLPGRFGWKAGQPTVVQQSSGAFLGDMGLSTTVFPGDWGDCTERQNLCRQAPHGPGSKGGNVEVPDKMLELVTFYARNLAVPKRENAEDPEVLEGKAVFHQAGCAKCHAPTFVTDSSDKTPREFRGQTIWPYTDLLLHDLGPDLADGFTEGVATGSEWRTAPLWGIGYTKAVSGHTNFLHDGRARNLLEAILWHGGEAEAARQNVIAMPPPDRQRLIVFLNSL